jgi:hypothetical protein
MKTAMLMELADSIASDLLNVARANGLTAHDLLMVAAITERLLQTALCSGDNNAVRLALQEADATFVAATTRLETN